MLLKDNAKLSLTKIYKNVKIKKKTWKKLHEESYNGVKALN
jgi:hypothetical protein